MSASILLVEDEPDVRLVVEDLLAAEGHAVECAADGREGMRRALEEPFDLLILDVMLPGPDGHEICRAACGRGFEGAILFLTARGQPTDRVQSFRLGGDDYLVKPFDPDELGGARGRLAPPGAPRAGDHACGVRRHRGQFFAR